MKRVLVLSNVDDEQRERLCALLGEHRIEHHVSPPSLFSPGNLWVADDADYDRAKTLVDEAVERMAREAREAHADEYRERFRGSYWRWLVGRIREEPVRLLQIAALIVFVWFGVVYWFL